MELKMPSSEQAYWGLRAMKTVAMVDGAIDASEQHMMESIQRIFGTTHELEPLAPVTPVELALALPDPQIRRQLVQGLIVMSLIDGKASPQETDLVEHFAQALEVSAPEVKNLRHVLNREIVQLRLDLVRRVWLRPKVKEIWEKEGIRGLFTFVLGMAGKYENAALAARYQALEQYPPVHSAVPIGNIVARMGLPCRGKGVAHRNRSCFTIARMSCLVMERPPKKKSRLPASAQAFSGANRGSSCFSSCCNSTWVSA
jgi:tellurite resistance protein